MNIPTNAKEIKGIIKETTDTFSKNDRALFVGVVAMFATIIGVLFYLNIQSQKDGLNASKDQRDAFLKQMEKRDEIADKREARTNASLDKLSESLNKNSQVMYELKNAINHKYEK